MKQLLHAFLYFLSFTAFCQNGSPLVTGHVTDEIGNPLAGAMVTWTGTNTPTFANEHGYFELVSTSLMDEIIVSCVNYLSDTIRDNLREHLNIRLKKAELIYSPIQILLDSSDIIYEMFHSKISEKKIIPPSQRPAFYPGGYFEMDRFVNQQIHYPASGYLNKISGTTEVKFTVNKEGRAVNPVIISSLGEDFDKEVINMIESMPRWLAAWQNGNLMETQIILPIDFTLRDF